MARKIDATDCTAVVEEADNALTDLSPHEELLLRLRFGIGGRRQPIAVISRRFGLQPQDLRDLEARALTHLRKIAIAQSAQRAQA
jgi:DNA-directed RNA polymerase sigma subunit (sigma70/sigma32)